MSQDSGLLALLSGVVMFCGFMLDVTLYKILAALARIEMRLMMDQSKKEE